MANTNTWFYIRISWNVCNYDCELSASSKLEISSVQHMNRLKTISMFAYTHHISYSRINKLKQYNKFFVSLFGISEMVDHCYIIIIIKAHSIITLLLLHFLIVEEKKKKNSQNCETLYTFSCIRYYSFQCSNS